MNRGHGSRSHDLRSRAFGTAGGCDRSAGTMFRLDEFVEPTGAIRRRFFIAAGTGPWKPRSGRVYDFPVRRIVDEK